MLNYKSRILRKKSLDSFQNNYVKNTDTRKLLFHFLRPSSEAEGAALKEEPVLDAASQFWPVAPHADHPGAPGPTPTEAVFVEGHLQRLQK